MVGVITQLVKPARVPLRYPCIKCYNFKHCAHDCLRKIEVQNMFRIKPTIITTRVNIITETLKVRLGLPKPNLMPYTSRN